MQSQAQWWWLTWFRKVRLCVAITLVDEARRPAGPNSWENRCWATLGEVRRVADGVKVLDLGIYSTQGVVQEDHLGKEGTEAGTLETVLWHLCFRIGCPRKGHTLFLTPR